MEKGYKKTEKCGKLLILAVEQIKEERGFNVISRASAVVIVEAVVATEVVVVALVVFVEVREVFLTAVVHVLEVAA